MVANKSHHFVPRCYLRNFSEGGNGKTISLFNLQREIFVHRAPIKSQCARDFLYGQDELEFHLGDIEGKYAEWITRGVLAEHPTIIPDIDLYCRLFCIVQYMRTEAHAARTRSHMQLTDALADIPPDSEYSLRGLDTSDSSLARQGVMMAIDAKSSIDDLAMTFLFNRTNMGFITCDDPVVLTNRLYFQRVGDSNFGFGSAGTVFYLPLSPRVAMMLYDSDVYSPIKRSRFRADIERTTDIMALNSLILLKAKSNVYVYDKSHLPLSQWRDIASSRIAAWESGRYLIPVAEEEGKKTFRETAERPPEGDYIIWTSQQHPKPLQWPSCLRFKHPAIAYSNGSGIGYLRKHTIPLGTREIERIKV